MAGTQQFRNVLLLGASGKLGRMVRALWQSDELSVVPVVRSHDEGHGGLVWSPGETAPDIGHVAAVVALWGVTPGPGCDLDENVCLAETAIELGTALGAEAVIHCSSGAVYRPGSDPVNEEMAPQPGSAYGQAKLEMEQRIAALSVSDGPRQIVLRIGNVAGADSLFGSLRAGGPIILDQFGDGAGPARSYISPRDLVRVITALIQNHTAKGIYNVSAPRPTAMADIVRACGVEVEWRKAPETAAQMVWLDTGRLERVCALPSDADKPESLVQSARDSGVWP